MAGRQSAGILLFRRAAGLEVLLGHLGGPFFARKDDGGWTVPKGEYADDETPLAAAFREFTEEMGSPPPATPAPLELGSIRRGGKTTSVWAVAGDFDVSTQHSNTFELQWPPRSGRLQAFPEVDRACWFDLGAARVKLVGGQEAFLDRLVTAVGQA